MIFSELYSAYYNAMARIITRAIEGDLTERDIRRIATESAFAESAVTIGDAIGSGRWQLLCPDLTTPMLHRPTMPLTELAKRWLRSISLDPRFGLFGVELSGLDGVEPLFLPEDIYVYDRYLDGDPFEDEGYIDRFRIILTAIRERTPLRIDMINRRGNTVHMKVMPQKLEYSEKDDKFRLISNGCRWGETVNLGRIVSCKPYHGQDIADMPLRPTELETVTISLVDERNTLERAMVHFAHFEKRAERIGDRQYRLTLKYDRSDETELVIRVLSFGPTLKVESPDRFVALIRERLLRQIECGL